MLPRRPFSKVPKIIAEVKTQSPFGFRSKASWDDLLAVAEKYGDMISIHVDPRWGGSLDKLSLAKKLTTKPILAKGFHGNDREVEESLAAGADYVLVVGRNPPEGLWHYCFVEPTSLGHLADLSREVKAVWNARDPRSGDWRLDAPIDVARRIFPGWLCQASGIQKTLDIDPGVNAVLVGEHLQEFVKTLSRF